MWRQEGNVASRNVAANVASASATKVLPHLRVPWVIGLNASLAKRKQERKKKTCPILSAGLRANPCPAGQPRVLLCSEGAGGELRERAGRRPSLRGKHAAPPRAVDSFGWVQKCKMVSTSLSHYPHGIHSHYLATI